MAIRITGRQVAVGSDLRELIESKLPRLEKYCGRVPSVDVTVSKDRYEHKVEMKVKAGAQSAAAVVKDANVSRAVEKLFDRVEQQFRKKNTKRVTSQKRHGLKGDRVEKVAKVVRAGLVKKSEEPPTARPKAKAKRANSARISPVTVEKLNVRVFDGEDGPLRTMSLEEAAEALFFEDENFLCFLEKTSGALRVIYRRKDGNFGLLRPLGK